MQKFSVGAAILLLSAPLVSAIAAEAVDPTTLSNVTTVAAKGYAHPETAKVREVRKSNATGGTGYCGEITVDGGDAYTTFHVVLTGSTGAGVLRLADFPNPDGSQQDRTVHELMRNFGCLN